MRFKESSHSSRVLWFLPASMTVTPDKISWSSALVIATYNCLFFSSISRSLFCCFIFFNTELSTNSPSSLATFIPSPIGGRKRILSVSYFPLACKAGRKTIGNSSPLDLWIVIIVTEFCATWPLETSMRVSASRIFFARSRKACNVPPCLIEKSIAIAFSFFILATFSSPKSCPTKRGISCSSSMIAMNNSGKGKALAAT